MNYVRFLRLQRADTDRTPVDGAGRAIQRVEGTKALQGPPRVVRGPTVLVRPDAISGVLPDKLRPDGAYSSLVQRNDGQGPFQAYQSADEIGDLLDALARE